MHGPKNNSQENIIIIGLKENQDNTNQPMKIYYTQI
jgi:hypothetical protein